MVPVEAGHTEMAPLVPIIGEASGRHPDCPVSNHLACPKPDDRDHRISQSFVEKILQSFFVFPFALPVVRLYARIWASLAEKGLIVCAHDLTIAATAISLDYSLITANRRDFEKIEGLKVEGHSLWKS